MDLGHGLELPVHRVYAGAHVEAVPGRTEYLPLPHAGQEPPPPDGAILHGHAGGHVEHGAELGHAERAAPLPLVLPARRLDREDRVRGYEPVGPCGLHDLVQAGAYLPFQAHACRALRPSLLVVRLGLFEDAPDRARHDLSELEARVPVEVAVDDGTVHLYRLGVGLAGLVFKPLVRVVSQLDLAPVHGAGLGEFRPGLPELLLDRLAGLPRDGPAYAPTGGVVPQVELDLPALDALLPRAPVRVLDRVRGPVLVRLGRSRRPAFRHPDLPPRFLCAILLHGWGRVIDML